MSFGIGLGAFVDAIPEGAQFRADLGDRRRVLDERERADAARTGLEGIDANAQAGFAAGVASGEYDADEFERYYLNEIVPAKRDFLLQQGLVEEAQQFTEWARSEDAMEGARLFGSAMFKAVTGDPRGALEDAIAAGQLGGYIDAGMEFVSQEEIVNQAGDLLGFRVVMKDENGREIEQDISVAQLPQVISTFMNPEAAWEGRQAAAASRSESGRSDRAGAIERLREQDEAHELDPDWVTFDEKSEEEQNAAIDRELRLHDVPPAPAQTYAAPGIGAGDQQVIVDNNTGQMVQPAGGAQLGATPPPAQAVPAPAQAPAAPPPQNEWMVPAGVSPGAAPSGAPPVAPSAAQPPAGGPPPRPGSPSALAAQQQVINEASAMIQRGDSPAAIASRLEQAGIPRNQWPALPQANAWALPPGISPADVQPR